MNYEQLITKNNSLLINCSFVVFPFFCHIMCIQFSNLQAVKRDWQSFNEQIYEGADGVALILIFPDFTISEVSINIFCVHVML